MPVTQRRREITERYLQDVSKGVQGLQPWDVTSAFDVDQGLPGDARASVEFVQ